MNTQSRTLTSGRAIPLTAIILLALAVHGPLLLMQLPANSYDANTHIFFSSHYANHWFSPWNEKWYGGFSQTTYPPLVHQWIALFSHVLGLQLAYMAVQLIVILLLPVGMYRYARLWVDERQASYAAIGSVFLGSLAMIAYQSGQLPTTMAAMLVLNALPYFYDWSRRGSFGALIKGLTLTVTAAAAHHVTLIFGSAFFALPVLWLAFMDRRENNASIFGVVTRAAIFAVLSGVAIAIVLLPYFMQLVQNPITQLPIPHGSRDNFILNTFSGMNFFVVPMGALLLAIPYILIKGASEHRLRPLMLGWYVTALIGLGGTTPVGRILFRRAFEVLTFERFTFWATLMAMPIVAILMVKIVDRFHTKGVVGLAVAAVLTFSSALSWMFFNPTQASPFSTKEVVEFLNRDDHSKFRYLVLGFGNKLAQVSTYANAGTVDGDYNSARMLPELTNYGVAQLNSSKFYGASGMEALRSMLKHADQYGLKYIFVRDRYYEPLLAFAGWRKSETYDNGNVTLWTNDAVPPAKKIEFAHLMPTPFEGLLWGLLPVGCSLLAIFSVILLPERRYVAEHIEFPSSAPAHEHVVLREAK